MNYAEEVARPIEEALVKAGAKKMCSNGDTGRGPDNRTPYYGSTFTLSKGKNEAIEIIYSIAKGKGYNLQHASPSNRGPLNSVADIYIQDWYFDNASKQSPYDGLLSGPVELSVVAYGEGQKNDCDQSTIKTGESTIGVGIRLPNYK